MPTCSSAAAALTAASYSLPTPTPCSTNNPGAPPTFYQCSDVVVLNLNTEAAAKVDATGSHDCLKEHQ